MILQALTEYYRALERQGKIAAPGWGPVKVSFALCIGDDGTLKQVVSVQTEQMRGKKTVLAPRVVSLPARYKRTVGVAANFLCDNSVTARRRRQGQAGEDALVLRGLQGAARAGA